jgi:hypothetical protein
MPLERVPFAFCDLAFEWANRVHIKIIERPGSGQVMARLSSGVDDGDS